MENKVVFLKLHFDFPFLGNLYFHSCPSTVIITSNMSTLIWRYANGLFVDSVETFCFITGKLTFIQVSIDQKEVVNSHG